MNNIYISCQIICVKTPQLITKEIIVKLLPPTLERSECGRWGSFEAAYPPTQLGELEIAMLQIDLSIVARKINRRL